MNLQDDPFLVAIRTTPADRTARLVYADWLDEHGDPRGELVRVCEAMRDEPVWSDRYWQLKSRRNELWKHVPLGWLEATGYDGSYYDPIFRSGIPDGVRERWRLIREFTERWHGIGMCDAGGRRAEVEEAEQRMGMRLPHSVREFVAYVHDCGDEGIPDHPLPFMLFHCASYRLDHLNVHPAVSLIDYSLSGDRLGVFVEDLDLPDPPTFFFRESWSNDVDYDIDGQPTPRFDEPSFLGPSVSQSVFRNLFIELPTAGDMETTWVHPDKFLARLHAEFPIHAQFDDADVFESDEMLVFVAAPSNQSGFPSGRPVQTLVRRPIPHASVPSYLFGTDDRYTSSSGMLGPEWFRRQQEEESRRPGYRHPPRWMSVLRRCEGERIPPPDPGSDLHPNADGSTPPQNWPQYEDGDEIPF